MNAGARAARAAGRRLVPARRPRAAAKLLLALALLALLAAGSSAAAAALAGCGNADPFVGVYYEPATARRFEITKDGDGYKLSYGVARRVFKAVRQGDELVVTDPLGGKTVVRPGVTEGDLELVSGGKTTLLRPLPGHQ